MMYLFVLTSSDKAFNVILTLLLITTTRTVLREINSSIRSKSWFATEVWDLYSLWSFSLHFIDSCCSVLFPDYSFSEFFDEKLHFLFWLPTPVSAVFLDFFYSSPLFCTKICFPLSILLRISLQPSILYFCILEHLWPRWPKPRHR